jgi:hypothetical protein
LAYPVRVKLHLSAADSESVDWPPRWITEAAQRENWPSDEFLRIGTELLRLDIAIEERGDGVGIVGFDQCERFVNRYRPIRAAVYKLVRAERERQRQRLTGSRSRGVELTHFYSEPS